VKTWGQLEGEPLEKSAFRVLVVDDYQPWRRFLCSMCQKEPSLHVVGEVSDGRKAVQQAQQLQPDVIILDVGLPSLNGIEAARQIRKLAPKSKILFVSQESSPDLVQEALNAGADGYVVKADAGGELLPALNAVLRGGSFLGGRFLRSNSTAPWRVSAPGEAQRKAALSWPQREVLGRHEVGFYSDDRHLLDHLTQFVGAALSVGNGAIVVATESHRDALFLRLQAQGVDIGAAIEEGRFKMQDPLDALSAFMLNGILDEVRFEESFGGAVLSVAKVARGQYPRVAFFGECGHSLLAQGKGDAAIAMERLGNELIKKYDVHFLCGYSLRKAPDSMDPHVYQQICAEHCFVHSR